MLTSLSFTICVPFTQLDAYLLHIYCQMSNKEVAEFFFPHTWTWLTKAYSDNTHCKEMHINGFIMGERQKKNCFPPPLSLAMKQRA